MTLTIWQWSGLLLLFVLGFAFDRLVGWQIRQGTGDFTARFVVIGVGGTLLVQAITAPQTCVMPDVWLLIALLHFAASGFWMVVGSFRRMGA